MAALLEPQFTRSSLLGNKSPRRAPQEIRVGLLGYGNVGRAVARVLAEARPLLHARGLNVELTAALVRDARRPRDGGASPAPLTPRLCDSPREFLSRQHDVVIEVLGGVEPAATIVRELLARGTHVVTANKSLIAAHGEELLAAARPSGAVLRCEAAAVAGVPLLNTLRDRPLVARAQRLVGIVNGTSHFVLSRLQHRHESLANVVAHAVKLGYAEPDPSFDLSGRDAAEKLCVLLQHLGIGGVRRGSIETVGVEQLTPDDLAQAAVFGGAIKPIVAASIGDATVDAFVGPAWLPATHALARLDGVQNGVTLTGPAIGELCFTGPGAGADVTAGTIVDDLIEIATGRAAPATVELSRRAVREPATAWFLRLEFAAGRSRLEAAGSILATRGIRVRGLFGLRQCSDADRLYTLTKPCDTRQLRRAIDEVQTALDCRVLAIRALS